MTMSKRQQELCAYVSAYRARHGRGPSYREIMRAMGYRSVSTVAVHVEALVAQGYLARRDRSARSLTVVGVAQQPDGSVAAIEAAQGLAWLRHQAVNLPLSAEQRRLIQTASDYIQSALQ